MQSSSTLTDAEMKRRLAAAYQILLNAADRIEREKAQAQGQDAQTTETANTDAATR